MVDIRVANAESDALILAEHNCAMALETENKLLDLEVAILGVNGLFKRPEFGFYLVAQVNGTVAATLMVTYEWSDWRNGLFWWIQSVYVKPQFRREGLYRGMYEHLKTMALGCTLKLTMLGHTRLMWTAACMCVSTSCLKKRLLSLGKVG